jgi:hypothetical protein
MSHLIFFKDCVNTERKSHLSYLAHVWLAALPMRRSDLASTIVIHSERNGSVIHAQVLEENK